MSIHKELKRNLLKSALAKYSAYLANVLSLMVLARIFSPTTFGIIATVNIIFLFTQMLAEAGISSSIINIRELSPKDRDGIFTTTIIFGALLSITLQLSTPLICDFYKNEKLSTIIPFTSLAAFFFSLSILPSALLLRDRKFFHIAISGFLAEFISTATAIILSFFVSPEFALATKLPTSALLTFVGLYYFSKSSSIGRPTPGTQISAFNIILKFSINHLGFNIINFFSRNLDNLVVARMYGTSALGPYDRAYQLMRYPLLLLTYALTPAIQPIIRDNAHCIDTVEKVHTEFTFKLSLAGITAGALMFTLSDIIVYYLLGSNWEAVTPIIRILSISIPIQIVLSSSGSFYLGMSRPDLLLVNGSISTFIVISSILIAVLIPNSNLYSICWALILAFALNYTVTYIMLYRYVFRKSIKQFAINTIPILVIFITECTVARVNLEFSILTMK